MAGERIMEALELADTEIETLREYDGPDATRGTVPRDPAGMPLPVA